MNQLLGKQDIEAAINLGITTLAKYEHATSAKYKNTLNSHVKGRLGEFALSKWLRDHRIVFTAHFQNDQSDQYCDIEVPTAKSFKSVEVKTWSSEFWESWGRCIAVAQIDKVLHRSDAILWCKVDLPSIKSVDQLRDLNGVLVEFVGYSLPCDAQGAPIRRTGPPWKLVTNHQLEDTDLRPSEDFFADIQDWSSLSADRWVPRSYAVLCG